MSRDIAAGGNAAAPDRPRPQAAGSRDALWFVAGLAIPVVAVMLVGWFAPPPGSQGMYGNIDGNWAAYNAAAILQWGAPFDLSPFSPISGLGNLLLPNLPWLNPGAWALALPDRELAYLTSYIAYALEISASIYLLARVIGLSAAAALLAALLHVFFLFPPFDGTFQASTWYGLAPVYAQLAALLNVGLALYLGLDGARPARDNLLRLGGLLLAVVLAFLTAPVTLLVFVPFYAALAAVMTLADLPARGWRATLTWRVAALAAALAMAALSGVLDYYRATAAVSARVPRHLPDDWLGWARNAVELVVATFQERGLCLRPMETMCGANDIIVFQLLALAGAAFWLVRGGRWRRLTGLFYLLFVPAGLVHAALYVNDQLGSLSILSPGFLSWSSYSLAAILAASLLSAAGGAAARGLGRAVRAADRQRRLPAAGRGGALLLGLALGAIGLWWMQDEVHPLLRADWALQVEALADGAPVVDQSGSSPVVAAAEQAVGLSPGDVFRGRVASFMGGGAYVQPATAADAPAPAGWENPMGWVVQLLAHRDQSGNRHWGSDLWERDIPTLGDYGQWITPLARRFVDRLLHTGVGGHGPNYLIASRLRPEILRLLGVSVVLADVPIPALQDSLLAAGAETDRGVLRAYRLDGANLGGYSPTELLPVPSLEAMAARIDTGGIDLRRQAFVLDGGRQPPAAPWVAAEAAELHFIRDGFRVSARADGRALLLLPLQYSACWQVQPGASPHPPIWLGRGDAVLTLVAFDRILDARFGFDFGLGADAACRFRDAEEMAAWLRR